MAIKQMRAVVVGAGTLLGKELAEELNNSAAAAWNLQLLDDSEEGDLQLSAAGEEPVLIQPLSREALQGADVVFFAGERSVTREFWRTAANGGASIVDLSGALEGEDGFLVRCPWVQGGTRPDLTTAGVISAHPAALMLALAADRLQGRGGLRSLTATVLEPASQAGSPGVDELHQQTVSLLSFQSVSREVFDSQVAFNLQTALGEASRVRLDEVRDSIGRHVRLLLGAGADTRIRLALVQAPVFHGYGISALAELTAALREEELRAALNGGVVSVETETAPSNLTAVESGDVLVSVRAEANGPSADAFWLWMAADNLRLASRNALACAQELVALRPATRVQ